MSAIEHFQMKLPLDIQQKLEYDFQNDSEMAYEILSKYVLSNDDINHPRIIRSILYLSNKSLDSLRERSKEALIDKRDVILWAEYNNTESIHPKQVRDFNKPFGESEIKRK